MRSSFTITTVATTATTTIIKKLLGLAADHRMLSSSPSLSLPSLALCGFNGGPEKAVKDFFFLARQMSKGGGGRRTLFCLVVAVVVVSSQSNSVRR